jgi:hypothetical protein
MVRAILMFFWGMKEVFLILIFWGHRLLLEVAAVVASLPDLPLLLPAVAVLHPLLKRRRKRRWKRRRRAMTTWDSLSSTRLPVLSLCNLLRKAFFCRKLI